MFKRILVPLDGSRYSGRAIKYAVDMAKHYSAEIILVHIVKPATPMIAANGIAPVENPVSTRIATQAALIEDKNNTSKARRYLSRKAREIKSQELGASYIVLVGEPGRSIMRFAKKEKIDLIIMTTHGKGGIKRAILGSVTDDVTRHSGTPILVVNPHANR